MRRFEKFSEKFPRFKMPTPLLLVNNSSLSLNLARFYTQGKAQMNWPSLMKIVRGMLPMVFSLFVIQNWGTRLNWMYPKAQCAKIKIGLAENRYVRWSNKKWALSNQHIKLLLTRSWMFWRGKVRKLKFWDEKSHRTNRKFCQCSLKLNSFEKSESDITTQQLARQS